MWRESFSELDWHFSCLTWTHISTVRSSSHASVELNTVGVVPDLRSLNRSLINYRAVSPLRFLPERDSQGQLKRRYKNGKELILSHHPLSVFSEAYRNIRTNLLLSQPEANRKVILITSPSPGEGKTATALNLGIAWAQDGFKVLIIDADMRRGSCHSGLGVSNRVGLSDLLAGGMSLETVIQQTSVEGLSLLPCGACPANPSGLLGTRKMGNIITQLRETFDFILLDSPPAMAISDPVVLSGVSDGILLVFHARKTTAHVARQVKERFDAIRAPVLGVILNGINVSRPGLRLLSRLLWVRLRCRRSHRQKWQRPGTRRTGESYCGRSDCKRLFRRNGGLRDRARRILRPLGV